MPTSGATKTTITAKPTTRTPTPPSAPQESHEGESSNDASVGRPGDTEKRANGQDENSQRQAHQESPEDQARRRSLLQAWEDDSEEHGYHVPPTDQEPDGADRLLEMTAVNAEDVKNALDGITTIVTNELPDTLSKIQSDPLAIKRIKSGDFGGVLKDAIKFGPRGKERVESPDPKAQKLVKGIKEYIGNKPTRIADFNEAREKAQELANAKAELRTAQAWKAAINLGEGDITLGKEAFVRNQNDLLVAIQQKRAEATGPNADQAKTALAELQGLSDQLKLVQETLRVTDLPEYKELMEKGSDEQRTQRLQQEEESISSLRGEVNERNNTYGEIVQKFEDAKNDHRGNPELVAMIRDLPVIFESTPNAYDQAKSFIGSVGWKKLEESGESLLAMILLGVGGLSLQQFQDGTQ